MEFEITNFDGTPIDPLVFTFTPFYSNNDHEFAVQTDDETQEGPHDFVIKAWYTDYATNFSEKDF